MAIKNVERKSKELPNWDGEVVLRTASGAEKNRVKNRFIQKHAEKASREGSQVYSSQLDNALRFPPGWVKPMPDLLIKRRNCSIVYLYETLESIESGKALSRWKSFENLKETKVRLVVENRKSARLVSNIKKENGFRGQIRCLKRSQPKRLNRAIKVLAPHKAVYAAAAVVAFMASLFVSGIIPNFFVSAVSFDTHFYKQAKRYQPKDIERQIQTITKSIRHSIK